MSYVADTHAMLWHLFPGSRRLGSNAQAIFDECEQGNLQIIIPAVVLAEMMSVIEKNRLENATMPQFLTQIRRMQSSDNYQFTPLRPALILASRKVAIPELFDRLIVTEALRLGFPILTRDRTIADSGIVPTIW